MKGEQLLLFFGGGGKCRLVSKKEKRSRSSKVCIPAMSLPNRTLLQESKTFLYTQGEFYQPAEGGPATGFLRSGSSAGLT